MPYGYLGTTPNQQKANSGVFSVEEALALQNVGELGGSIELIAEETISSNTTTVDFTSIKENIYDVHLLTYTNIHIATSGTTYIGYQLAESGTLETADVYSFSYVWNAVSGTSGETKSTGDNHMNLGIASSHTMTFGGYTYFYKLGDSAKYSFTTGQTMVAETAGTCFDSIHGAVLPQTSAVNQIRLMNDNGDNFTAGTLKLYGVKQI